MSKGTGNPYCPEGYRTPSQIEAAIMRYYMGELFYTMTRTYWSFGPKGINIKNSKKPGFVVQGTNITVSYDSATGSIHSVRCVRDVRTD